MSECWSVTIQNVYFKNCEITMFAAFEWLCIHFFCVRRNDTHAPSQEGFSLWEGVYGSGKLYLSKQQLLTLSDCWLEILASADIPNEIPC